MGTGGGGHGPSVGPAVAVKHRERPEIDRLAVEPVHEHVAERVQIGAAVVIDDPLRPARRARRVVERDRLPLVIGPEPVEIRCASGKQRLVALVAEAPPLPVVLRQIVDRHHERAAVELRQRLLHDARERGVGDQHTGAGVVQHPGDRSGVEAKIEGIEHGARHRHAEMGLQHGRYVRRHDRDRVTEADSTVHERAGQPAAALVGLGVASPHRAVHHGRPRRIDLGRPGHEIARSQRGVVGWPPFEPKLVAVAVGHLAVLHR